MGISWISLYLGIFILILWVTFGFFDSSFQHRLERKKLINSLYEHKLWFKRIKEGTYHPFKNLPFVDLSLIETIVSSNNLSSELNVYVVNSLELHLHNIEDIGNEIQIFQINNANLKIQDIETNFAYKEVIKKIKSAESKLDECLIYLEHYGEETRKPQFSHPEFSTREKDYFIEKIRKKMQKLEYKNIKIRSDLFACLNCNLLFLGKICPACESKLKIRVKNPIK